MNAKILILALIGSLFLGGVSFAEMYKWVDEKGAIHFSDQPPEDTPSGEDVESIPIPTYRTAPAPQAGNDIVDRNNSRDGVAKIADNVKRRRPPEVELYTTSWCGYCGKARTYFWIRGIPFKEYDIEKDKTAALRKRELDPRRGVPFAVINGQLIHGFSPTAYARALDMTP